MKSCSKDIDREYINNACTLLCGFRLAVLAYVASRKHFCRLVLQMSLEAVKLFLMLNSNLRFTCCSYFCFKKNSATVCLKLNYGFLVLASLFTWKGTLRCGFVLFCFPQEVEFIATAEVLPTYWRRFLEREEIGFFIFVG